MTGLSGISIADETGDQGERRLAGVARVLGPRWLQLPTLTIGLLGVQVFWSIEMSYATPYLISLGLSKSAVAIVFLAGPVSGLIVQPLIGLLADNSKSRFGRRRPYMLAGTCVCFAAMLLLGYTRPFASIFTSSGSNTNNVLTIWLAIFALFTVDFSINAVQAVDRALIVDTLPSVDQAEGNAWAARMLGFGSVVGYFIGNVDMTVVLPFLGDTELEVLSIFGSFVLVAMQLVTALCTQERIVVQRKSAKTFAQELRDMWWNALHLPSVIRQICIIQFCAWVGWFPVLFYTTAFIGDLHKRAHPERDPSDPALAAEATRLGSRALFYSSLLSLACNILLPFVVAETVTSRKMMERKLMERKSRWLEWFERCKIHLATLWAVSHAVFAVCMTATFFYQSVWGATLFTTITGFSWSITQWAPFSLLAEAILADTGDPAEDGGGAIRLHDARSHEGGDEDERQFLVADSDDEREDGDRNPEEEVRSFRSSASMDSVRGEGSGTDGAAIRENANPLMGNLAARASHAVVSTEDVDVVDEIAKPKGQGLAAKAGIIIGIHNIFVVMPQFVMTAVASIIFAILEPGRSALGHDGAPVNGTELAMSQNATDLSSKLLIREVETQGAGPNSYAIVFRIGGAAAAVAFILTLRLVREMRLQ